jgi:hypothetical protein
LNKHSTGILFLLLNENGNVRLFSWINTGTMAGVWIPEVSTVSA